MKGDSWPEARKVKTFNVRFLSCDSSGVWRWVITTWFTGQENSYTYKTGRDGKGISYFSLTDKEWRPMEWGQYFSLAGCTTKAAARGRIRRHFMKVYAEEMSQQLNEYSIYYRDREYARVMGDPKLTTVMANSKEEAERIASKLVSDNGAGLWAVKENGQQL